MNAASRSMTKLNSFHFFIFMEIAEKTNNEKNKFEESENLQISRKNMSLFT
jgi:hypothetical protein